MKQRRVTEKNYIFVVLIFSIIIFCTTTIMTSHRRQIIGEQQEELHNLIQLHQSKRVQSEKRNISYVKKTNQFEVPVKSQYTDWFLQSLSTQIDTVKAADVKQNLISGGLSRKRTLSNTIEIIKEINGKMFRIRQSPYKFNMKEPDNCAIVGNGGVLRNSRCGDEINAHDFVFRINMAPIHGYDIDVGDKVDFMALNSQGTRQLVKCITNPTENCSESLQTLSLLDKAYLWFSKYTTVDLKLSSKISQYVNTTILHPQDPLGDFIQKLWNTTSYPSSGLFVYSLASTICKRISLYGFYPFSKATDGTRLTYNYYSSIKIGDFVIGHNIPNEYQILQDLQEKRVIRLVTTACPKIEKYVARNRKFKRFHKH
ncbi:CMP-N-acetylneuraminate-poly-alpha-2,8-sialyltransferase-like [Antedon mediterranea]|uniref:CMP-N-acetylneuraminate-poly-alpha-2, 8-sialyltransferase-like n=1 Tax=Antedon mediterranea TaxID=105859 RepID=UPI003AF54F75